MNTNPKILTRFVECFDWENNEFLPEEKPLVQPFVTDRAELLNLYTKVPGPFPELFENLLLAYRWFRTDLGEYRLLANPPGPDFSGFEAEIFNDKYLAPPLLAEGFVQFGFDSSRYDPVCFDTRGKSGVPFAIVMLDHEDILCRSVCFITQKLAANFSELVLNTISSRKMELDEDS